MALAPDIYKRIIAAKLYIDRHFHEPIGLDLISREACISRFHFHRLFTRIYHQTPHQYLTRKRIDHARELLAEKKLSVGEVCSSVGFESMASFSGLFKKEMGLGPRHYRQKARKRKEASRAIPMKFIPHCFIETYRLDQE